jgi:mono/diheme cytochrome c family protein
MRIFLALFVFAIVAVISIFGLRGQKSEKPPLYVFPDMDRQPKWLPQGTNDFFDNRMNDRPEVQGAVPRGNALDKAAVFNPGYQNREAYEPELMLGKEADGSWTTEFPMEASYRLIETGRQQYDIFCSVCHGKTGDGKGITSYNNYGINIAASFHSDKYREMPNGQLYNTIVNGYGQMMGYGDKLSLEERWAIVLYMRALQRAYYAESDDLTPDQKETLGL